MAKESKQKETVAIFFFFAQFVRIIAFYNKRNKLN